MSEERWLRAYPDGRIVLCTENDGATFLHCGAEAVEETVTPKELRNRYPSLLEELERSGGQDTPNVCYVR
jgi:hypothetical protein